MDDKLYEAARFRGTEGGDVIPTPANDDGGLYYLRVTPGDGSSALHVAAQHGNHEFVQVILGRVNPQELILCKHNSKGENPLHLAAESGSLETVEEILKAHDAGEDMYSIWCWRERDKNGDTPLHIALRHGHEEIAGLMLERDLHYVVSLNNNVGESLAFLAAQNYCPMFMLKILEADRDGLCTVSFSGPFGQTAFHPTRQLAGDILSISIERRTHLLKVQDKKGKTVLHYAVEEERYTIVEILLKADNTLCYLHDNDGMTPLHIAASKGFLEIIQMILELCPQSITIRDKRHGQTALHVLKMDGSSLEKCLNSTRMRQLINQVDNDGNTPLHLALMNSDLATADKLLLVDGINWRLTNKLGYSPMDLCVSDDQIPLKLKRLARECRAKEVLNMKIFFHKNVVNADDALHHYGWDACLAFKGPQGDNILHTAARDGNLKIIERVKESDSARSLLLSGRNSKGETPLHLAAEYGNLEVVRFILQQTSSGENINDRDSAVVTIENVTTSTIPPWRNLSNKGDTPAHRAIRNRHAQVALLLLKRDPGLITVKNNAEESLLYLAADNKCYDVITTILSKDREYDDSITSGRSGQNFFHAATRCPRFYKKKYTSLIKNKLHLIQKVDDNGKTPLHYAIEQWRHMTASWLLQHDKSAAFVYDNEGFTPLLRAAILGRSRCIRQILTLCPQSAKLRDLRCNRTVLHLTKMPHLFHHICMRHDVLKHIVNEIDKDGNTALHCAILDGDVDKALVLLDTEGINWTIRNNQQKSPRDLCEGLRINGETRQVLKKLVNETDKDGNTALHCAILDGDVDKALVLLKTQGINWTIRNNQHKSPWDLCRELSVDGETKQRPISIALASLSFGEGSHPLLGSWLKTLLLAYNNLIMTDENLKKMLDNIAVVAALLVTITFAATFTIPGGYNQNTGEAMLTKRAAVKVFIASDVLAMLMAISILIWYTLGGRGTRLRKLAMDCIIMLQISLMATIVSFISGVFAIGWHVKFVVIVPVVIAALLNLFFIFRNEFFELYF